MDDSFPSTKRKMNNDITENFEGNSITKKNKGNGVRSERFSIREIKGDLFSSPSSNSLAHCVSQDLRMGKGIAVLFKNKFGGIQELQSKCLKIGDTGVLSRDGRYIYYLITKERHWHKPTYLNLRSSLEALKEHALQNEVTSLAMPKIGCGLDGLVWEKVKDIITDVFKDTDIKISVYFI